MQSRAAGSRGDDLRQRRRGCENSPGTAPLLELIHMRHVSMSFIVDRALSRQRTSRKAKRCDSIATERASTVLRRKWQTHADDGLLDHVCSKQSSATSLQHRSAPASIELQRQQRVNSERRTLVGWVSAGSASLLRGGTCFLGRHCGSLVG